MSNWWSQRLSGDTHPRSATPPIRPSQPRQPAPPPRPAASTHRPPLSSLQDETCPSCGSTNYMAPVGTQKKRCLECGYPVVQSGSGVGSVGQTDGTVKKAVQPESGGYNPSHIVGRVD